MYYTTKITIKLKIMIFIITIMSLKITPGKNI